MQDTDASTTPDQYAQQYMTKNEQVLAFQKQVSRAPLFAVGGGLLFGLLAVVVQSLTSSRPLSGTALLVSLAIFLPYLLLLGAFWGVTRVLVTDQFVRISLGLFGPEIPIASIVDVKTIDYTSPMGVRPFGDTTYYHSGGGTGSVQITWKKPDGQLHKSIVGLTAPALIAEAIERARSASQRGVRVEQEQAPTQTEEANEQTEQPAQRHNQQD